MVHIHTYFILDKPKKTETVELSHLTKTEIDVIKHQPVFPGYIEIIHNDQLILGKRYQDSVDHFWLNLIDGLEKLKRTGAYSIDFLYQPLRLQLLINDTRLSLSILHDETCIESWDLPKEQAIISMLHAAEEFMALINQDTFTLFQSEIGSIQQKLTDLNTFYKT
ncbi:hypothetical protein [Alkalihalophilus marmarensis]|uniref:Uncharacterized protein n=1 Tax=Alkalihalophilus marmarensis DSM 21297 TaxID=1188261 RepID=U6SMK5_9BACI|nr:hypothetical protein [Alkalihalophilus marmarensis]ERN52160.1 hypothetical protein A33I_16760 [Alkalihalophilus marmarensis DSM 21297]MED1600127.1 hypothetical protein [Alkalihalophilus marmarensis]